MGLYLTIFDAYGNELDGVEVGSYADFGAFREAVADHVEGGIAGSVCPILIRHSDCDGRWTPSECAQLLLELAEIRNCFLGCPPMPLDGTWKGETVSELGLTLKTLCDCFIDVEGDSLIERLTELCRLSCERNLPILFQ